MTTHRSTFTTPHPIAGALALSTVLIVAISTGCSRDEPAPIAAQVAATASGDTRPSSTLLPLREGDRLVLQPIHEGVQILAAADAAKVTYTRARGKAFGAAYMLTPGMLNQSAGIEIAIRTQPSLRPQVCFTDAAGNVWNAPFSSGVAPDRLRFDLERIQPDPFQNAGRTLPASPDLGSMRMLTILDISGFMGGAEAPCEWTIDQIALTPRSDAPSAAQAAGGAR